MNEVRPLFENYWLNKATDRELYNKTKREILKYQTIRKQQKQMIPRVSSAAAKEKKTDTAQLSLKRNPYPQAFLSENKKIKSSLM